MSRKSSWDGQQIFGHWYGEREVKPANSIYDEKITEGYKALPKIIAVDFDGCLVKNAYPEIGEPKWDVVAYVKRKQAEGWKLILWTCRSNNEQERLLNQARDFCKYELNLTFDAYNQNISEVQALYGYDTRKVYATEYLDDKAVNCTGWNKEASDEV